MRIAGAKILVTGASSGIGAARAPLLARRGATVGLVARREARLAEVLAACRRHAPGSRMWVADLGDLERAEQVARDAWDAFGGLDALVNNAAIPKRKAVPDLTAGEIAHVMAVDFHSPVRMSLALLPAMLARGSGLVVNVGSVGGRIGIAREAAYCAAKFALSGWSEVMAMDLAGTGVEVKLVLPGPIATEIWETKPGDAPAFYAGPFVPAEDCAADIAAAIEAPGFEFYAPAAVPGGLDQKALVVGKTRDVEGFLAMMAEVARPVTPRPPSG
jgi:short-subunit dehydrogenase